MVIIFIMFILFFVKIYFFSGETKSTIVDGNQNNESKNEYGNNLNYL